MAAKKSAPTERKANLGIEKAEAQIKEYSIPYEYDTKEYPIEVLLFKYSSTDPENSTIIIPSYQREFIWPDSMKSRFIESLFLGVPIQPLFAATLKDGTLELIDGSQRIRAIEAFKNDEFKLSGLKKLDALNGFYYSDFSMARKNKFGLINLRLHVINEKADLSIRQDIFDRINTTGVKVKPAELRKGAMAGKFYEFVTECANDSLFAKLCPITSNARKRGEAEELVLRFFAYSEYGTRNKAKGSRLLDMYLLDQNKQIKRTPRKFDPSSKRSDFDSMLNFVEKYFPLGFKKTVSANSTPRVRFEAISLGVHFALKENPNLVPASMDWLDSEGFEDVTTSDSSINPGKLQKRVDFVKNSLLGKASEGEQA